jgi:Transposase DDE domain
MKAEIISSQLVKTDFMKYLHELLSGDVLEEIAQSTGFISRSSSRISGESFLRLNVCDFGDKGGMSLTEKCDWLAEEYGIELTKQSLDGRYNTFAVKFMRHCFEEIFKNFTKGFEGLKGLESKFSAVKLTDATSFQLPKHLAVFYAGNGGSTSNATIKIHQSYELLKGQIVDFHITDGKANDTTYWNEGNLNIFPKELYLTDLGYYTLPHLATIAREQAYFISRYKTGTNLYLKDDSGHFVELDLAELVSKVSKDQEFEEVYIGKEAKLAVRLVIEKLPEEIRLKRLKKLKAQQANQSKQSNIWKSSALKKLLCGFNLFITNATQTLLSSSEVGLYYRLRWQIELLFKIWKSILAIDKVGQMNIFRFECYLYGKFIALLISHQIQAFLRDSFACDPDIAMELSEWKAMKYLKKK